MTHEDTTKLPHVVVLGGGFGGMTVCNALSGKACRVTLIDKTNHHLFQPLLYQVATGGLSAPDIAMPLRKSFRHGKNVTVYMESVKDIHLDAKTVVTDHREIPYDYIVIALGARTSYFGQNHWAEHTLELKTLSDALRIRRHVLASYEAAELETDPAVRERLTTTVIVGGGPTGVEMAGALAELNHHVFKGNFRNFDPKTSRIILVEATDRLLQPYDESQSQYTRERLEKMGVEVITGKPVKDVQQAKVCLGDDGTEIVAGNIIWAAGVEAPPLTRRLGIEHDKAGKLFVNPDLSLPGYPEAFAIGDLVKLKDGQGKPVPGVAPAAMQMGNYVARLLKDRFEDNAEAEPKPFVYTNKGDMATIGRGSAVADVRGWKTKGVPAWFLWLVVHILFLAGFRNRIMVFINWVYAYCTFDRGARVIIGEPVEREKELAVTEAAHSH